MDDPSRPNGHRTIKRGERTIYDNEWVRLTLVDIEPPHGQRFEHHVVHMKPVAIAVLMSERNEVLMLRRHRFATDEWGTSCWAASSRSERNQPPPLPGKPSRRAGTSLWVCHGTSSRSSRCQAWLTLRSTSSCGVS